MCAIMSKTGTKPSTRGAGFLCASLAIAAAVGTCAASWADEASDSRAGEELAAKVCSPCHVVAKRSGPPFAEIAKGSKTSPEALRAFLSSTHADVSHPGAMPNMAL